MPNHEAGKVLKMAGIESKNFSEADETRTPEKTLVEFVDLQTVKAAKLTLQPGWSWSGCVKPVVGGDSCQQNHIGVCVSGSMRVTHDDGTEVVIKPGDAYSIKPGHDGTVLGDEVCVMYEFDQKAAETYAT